MCTVDYEKKKVLIEVKPSSADLRTPEKANKFTALIMVGLGKVKYSSFRSTN